MLMKEPLRGVPRLWSCQGLWPKMAIRLYRLDPLAAIKQSYKYAASPTNTRRFRESCAQRIGLTAMNSCSAIRYHPATFYSLLRPFGSFQANTYLASSGINISATDKLITKAEIIVIGMARNEASNATHKMSGRKLVLRRWRSRYHARRTFRCRYFDSFAWVFCFYAGRQLPPP